MSGPKIQDHVWQSGRWISALDTSHFQPDERTTTDLVHRAVQFARLLTYYDADNCPHFPVGDAFSEKSGAWEAFFRNDVSFLLAEISAVDAEREFRMSRARDADVEGMIAESLRRIGAWYARARELSEMTAPGSVENALLGALDNAIRNELSSSIRKQDGVHLRSAEKLVGEIDELLATDFPARIVYSAVNRVSKRLATQARQFLSVSLEEKADHPPQIALYLTFVSLLQKSTADLNRLTEQHLRFYYDKVLQLVPSAAVPDRAHLTFELAQHVKSHVLPQGSELVAESGTAGQPTTFTTDATLEINTARVEGFKAIRVSGELTASGPSSPYYVRGVSAFPVADSTDGFGAQLEDPAQGWQPFGPAQGTTTADAGCDPHAEIGIAIAAPVLHMKGGTRTVALTLTFADTRGGRVADAIDIYRRQAEARYEGTLSDQEFARFVSQAFSVHVSVAAGFMKIDELDVDCSQAQEDTLIFRFVVPSDAPAIEATDATGDTSIGEPMLKLLLNPHARFFGYSAFRNTKIAAIRIDVDVAGLRELELTTDLGPVDPSKPFPPFGPLPIPGAGLLFSSPELRRKSVGRLNIELDWRGLPQAPDDFATHYADYGLQTRNDSFRVTTTVSDGRVWRTLTGSDDAPTREGSGAPLFAEDSKNGGLLQRSAWTLDCGAVAATASDSNSSSRYAAGSFKVELVGPHYGFGHGVYPGLVTKHALASADKATNLIVSLANSAKGLVKSGKDEKEKKAGVPKPPLLPLVAAMSVGYTASAETDYVTRAGHVTLYHMTAFGRMIPARNGQLVARIFDFDGVLMIGLSGVEAPQVVTLLFDLHVATAPRWSPESGFRRPKWKWGYLAGDRWQTLPDENILLDDTRGLTRRGIVKLALPNDFNGPEVSSSAPGWLGLLVQGDVDRYGRIISVTTQAVTATRSLTAQRDGQEPRIPAGTAWKTAAATPAVARINQPFDSDSGRAAESRHEFRLRASERLRHKNRAIQTSDYSRMVLAEFPQIAEAYCYRSRAGRIDVIVTPRRHTLGKSAPPVVALNLRYEISRWLRQYTSPWVDHVIVRNPSYETIKVTARIVASSDATSAVIATVEAAVDRIIAPWQFDLDAPLPIGRAVLDVSSAVSQIEELDVVDKVAGLSMLQKYVLRDDVENSQLFGLKDTARCQPHDTTRDGWSPSTGRAVLRSATPWSVFVPARSHAISYLGRRRGLGQLRIARDLIVADPATRDDYMTGKKMIPLSPTPAGIGNLAIGDDLVIVDEVDAISPSSDTDTLPHRIDRVFMPTSGLQDNDR